LCLEKMEPSLQGSGGSTSMFKAAVVGVKGFSLPEQDVMDVLMPWNERTAQPPWSRAELLHKVRDAAKSTKPDGYMLNNDDAFTPAYTPRHRAAPMAVDPTKEEQRRKGPSIHPIGERGVQTIADLRGLPVIAVEMVKRAGFLGKTNWHGHDCFVLGEGKFAQARPFDGGLLPTSGGAKKSKNLPGSEGAFIGRKWCLESRCPVLLVEGAIGLVEAVAAILGRDAGWAPLAAVSASSRFARDPELLQSLAGRHVRIIPDDGDAGHDAAAIWLAELETVGATVDAIQTPDGCKDLGDVMANAGAHSDFLNSLFQ
jgi:hypothetical protein